MVNFLMSARRAYDIDHLETGQSQLIGWFQTPVTYRELLTPLLKKVFSLRLERTTAFSGGLLVYVA